MAWFDGVRPLHSGRLTTSPANQKRHGIAETAQERISNDWMTVLQGSNSSILLLE